MTVVERGRRPGGTLFFAGLAYTPNAALLASLVAQVTALPIDVRCSTEATAALVAELRPDVVVVATGARRGAPPIPGADLPHVWTGDELRRLLTGDRAEDIAARKLTLAQRALLKAGGVLGLTDDARALEDLSKLWMPLGQHVTIVGGGLVGLELAEFLLARGRDVVVLESSDKPGRELTLVRRWRVLDAVEKHGRLERQARVTSITPAAVIYADAQGVEQRIATDSVILAVGAETDDSVARSLQSCGVPLHLAGDCREIGYIEGALRDGHEAGRTV